MSDRLDASHAAAAAVEPLPILPYAKAEDAGRRPIVELLRLSLPTIAQMTSYTVMQFTDTYMLNVVGDVEATAAGMGGFLAFALISLGFGTLMIINTLVSQAFGRRDFRECGQFLWQGIWFGLASGLVLLPFLPWASGVFGLLGHEPRLAELEAAYFRITLSVAAVKLVGLALGQFLLAVDRPNLVLVAAVIGSIVDFGGNWVLIYGHLGFPAMGVQGGAYASNVGQVVEAALLAWFAFGPKIARVYNTFDWRPRWAMFRTLLVVGVPSGFQVVAEVVAWALFTVWVCGQFGTTTLAGTNLAFNYMKVSFMPAFGLSAAVTALVGRYIGAGQPEVAVRRAHLGFAVAAVYMIACGLLFFFGRYWLIDLFTNDPDVLRVGAILMVFGALYQFFDAAYIIYNGALRGAGDTFVPAVVTGTLCWGVTVGVAYFIATRYPQWGIIGPWTAALSYGGILSTFLFFRFIRGKWRNIHLEEETNEPAVRGPLSLSPVLGGEGGGEGRIG